MLATAASLGFSCFSSLLFNSERSATVHTLIKLPSTSLADREVVSETGSEVRATSASLVHAGTGGSRQLQKSCWWRRDEPGGLGFFFFCELPPPATFLLASP